MPSFYQALCRAGGRWGWARVRCESGASSLLSNAACSIRGTGVVLGSGQATGLGSTGSVSCKCYLTSASQRRTFGSRKEQLLRVKEGPKQMLGVGWSSWLGDPFRPERSKCPPTPPTSSGLITSLVLYLCEWFSHVWSLSCLPVTYHPLCSLYKRLHPITLATIFYFPFCLCIFSKPRSGSWQ